MLNSNPLPKPLPDDQADEYPVPPQRPQGRIVGIGTSAEGFEALEQLFDALPPDTGMAFVVVQHLSPDFRSFRSMMDELIARHSTMPVVIATHMMPVCADHIYLMPPHKQMIIHDRHLVLAGKESQVFTLPIDAFFRSLAQDAGEQAIAIVLSGSGSDGSRGVVEVKRAGGLVLAETAASATFDSMPLSAAATGMVDHASGPRDLARLLCGLLSRDVVPDRPTRSSDGHRTTRQAEPPVFAATQTWALDRARAHIAELSAIVEASEDAIIGSTLGGTITTWNRGAERLYGYPARQAIGRNIRMLMQDGRDAELERHFERIQRGEKVEHVRSLCRHRDGIDVEVSTTFLPIHDRRGVVTAVSAIGRDISPLIAAERELEDRQRRIATLLDQAEENARRREQFIAMLSHELRNPLAAVMSAATLIVEQSDMASITRSQAVIERQARQMKRLLDDLLDVSWITHGNFKLLSDDVDLRVPIELAIESTSPLFAERRVRLDYSLPGHPVPVRGDASRLVQVVMNLLSNAATYSPPQTTVRLRVTIQDGHGVLRVIDQGLGIEPELQGKIFELFVQSEQHLDRSRGGLGVGLSLAKRIVDLHGGTIEVHSEGPGKGSEFKVAIPLAIPLIERKVPSWGHDHAPVPPSARCRIVLVDDQADSREMLRLLLESRDHVVIDVEDGATALDVITREKPDVAFIDIGLPAMNGYEVAQRIRDRPGLDDVLLVALTGYGAPSDISMARAAGFDEHLVKPAELAKLENILATKILRMAH